MAKAQQIKGLDCQAAANIGIRLVLLERFDELESFRHDALKWEDIEGVHSMRVASRRLRSALRDFGPYIKKRGLAQTLKRVKAVADALGEVRDQDVAITALESLASKTSPDVSKALGHVIEQRKEVRQEARKGLKDVVGKHELGQLSSQFREAIETATSVSPRSRSDMTYIDVARLIIRDRLGELEKQSDNLYRPFDVEALHELRITGKRLRYAIELFDQCWTSSTLPVAKRISRLQSSLGDIHDCDVWIVGFGKQIIEARKHDHESNAEAFAWLISYFMKMRIGHLREAFSQWNNWKTEDVSNTLRDAIKS